MSWTMRPSSNSIKGHDEPCCKYEEDERHRHEYEVAHSCYQLSVVILSSEALWLHKGVEQVDEEADGAETGQPCYECSAHSLTSPVSDETPARVATIGVRGSPLDHVGRGSVLVGR